MAARLLAKAPLWCTFAAAAAAATAARPASQPTLPLPPAWAAAVQEPGSTVLVAGATGGVGQLLTVKLLEVSR